MNLAGREQEIVESVLRGAGVPRDGVLFVHAAFRRLGQEGLTVDRFIEALRDGITAEFQIRGEVFPRRLEPFIQFGHAARNRARDRVACPGKAHCGVPSRLRQALDKVVPLRRQLIGKVLPPPGQRRS